MIITSIKRFKEALKELNLTDVEFSYDVVEGKLTAHISTHGVILKNSIPLGLNLSGIQIHLKRLERAIEELEKEVPLEPIKRKVQPTTKTKKATTKKVKKKEVLELDNLEEIL